VGHPPRRGVSHFRFLRDNDLRRSDRGGKGNFTRTALLPAGEKVPEGQMRGFAAAQACASTRRNPSRPRPRTPPLTPTLSPSGRGREGAGAAGSHRGSSTSESSGAIHPKGGSGPTPAIAASGSSRPNGRATGWPRRLRSTGRSWTSPGVAGAESSTPRLGALCMRYRTFFQQSRSPSAARLSSI